MEEVNLTDEELNNLLTEEVMDYWIGYEHKQARINLFYECKYDPKVLESVLDHWEGR
tara:strand:+ start:661 stop:831 length:171 start_codon:yes stop_codon:yes gene_type:complete